MIDWLRRLGSALVAPRWLAVKLLDQKPGRATADVLALLLLIVVLAEPPRLVRAYYAGRALGWEIGAQSALQALNAVVFILLAMMAAGIVLSFLLGRGEDPKLRPRMSDRGLDLAAYATVPYLLVKVCKSLLGAFLEAELDGWKMRVAWLSIGVGWTVLAAGLGYRALRAAQRTNQDQAVPPPPAPRPRTTLVLGAALVWTVLLSGARPLTYTLNNLETLSRVAIERGKPAPGWTLPASDGRDVSLDGQRGRTVVLAFWAMWCGVCKQELPLLDKLARSLDGKQAALYTVNTDGQDADTRAAVRAYFAERGLSLPVLFDNGSVAGLYNVTAIPNLVVISPTGNVTKTFLGITTPATIEAAIRDAASR